MLTFDLPWAALALPLPLLTYWLLPPAHRQQPALRVPFFSQLATLAPERESRPRPSPRHLLLAALIWCLLVLAACGPRWIGDPLQLPVSGRDLLLAVDISGSMQIEDMVIGNDQVMRVVAIKAVVEQFIRAREGDRIGLILFGSRAYLQAPLTFDRETVAQLLREAQVGFAGEETAIGDAIGLAVKRLRERPGTRHVLILLTDGANTSGTVSPVEAARVAAGEGIVIYTIGIGATEMITRGLFGTGFGARRINPSVDLDEDALQEIARLTGGRYFRARNPQELIDIYALLDELEPVGEETRTYRPQRSLYHWPLAGALLLSVLWATASLLRARRLATRPASRGVAS
ncbi:MAG: VWA domain-containing protein [Spongiibacteraceae bacterium]|jgi:Ca-activated chloride channel family protein|nr:VWA domain-containing protein [Spongiibacteraceae bacterium]